MKTFTVRRRVVDYLAPSARRELIAVDDVSFSLQRNETLGIVGESGSGKTTLARCLVRLVTPERGSIEFDGTNVLTATSAELRTVRRRMQMIYQDPYSSLNPRMTVGAAIAEPARVHGLVARDGEARYVEELLAQVGLAQGVAPKRPRELSGGQRQRVAIARALAAKPDVIIADEPVSALDVSIQAQILNLLEGLRNDLGLATVIIAHQLSVVAHLSQRVIVMYLGRVVEEGTTEEVFLRPQHPYTAALLKAHPSVDGPRGGTRPALRGDVPSPLDVPSGCRFRTRCPLAEPRCAEIDPPAVSLSPTHRAWCLVMPKVPEEERT